MIKELLDLIENYFRDATGFEIDKIKVLIPQVRAELTALQAALDEANDAAETIQQIASAFQRRAIKAETALLLEAQAEIKRGDEKTQCWTGSN